MPKTLKDYRNYLFAFLVIGAPLSFVPSIATPALDFPSFRLGLYQLLAAVFIAITIVPLYKDLNKLVGLSKTAYISVAIIAFTALISLLFGGGQPRGALLTASLMFLIMLLLSSWWYVTYQLKHVPKQLINIFLLSGVMFAVLAIMQLLWGTFNDSGGLLCKGCKSAVFGFPRVNVTAAEPLFFANSMLPILMASFYLSFKRYKYSVISLFASTLAIGLTFARGGYLAAAIGLLVIACLAYIYKKASFKQILTSFLIIAMGGFISLSLLVASATIRFYDTTPNIAYNTLQSMAEHLSLGVVRLPDKNIAIISTNNTNPDDDFASPGLIESSTNERLGSADLALDAWRFNLKNIVIGTGLGNLGPFVVNNISPSAPSNLTVYVFYILFLAELGLVGLLAFTVLLGSIIYRLFKNSKQNQVYTALLGLMLAFAVQFFFFGSYINVVYIWLWLGIALGILSNKNLDFQGIIHKDKVKNEK